MAVTLCPGNMSNSLSDPSCVYLLHRSLQWKHKMGSWPVHTRRFGLRIFIRLIGLSESSKKWLSKSPYLYLWRLARLLSPLLWPAVAQGSASSRPLKLISANGWPNKKNSTDSSQRISDSSTLPISRWVSCTITWGRPRPVLFPNVRIQDDEVLSILSTPSSEPSISTRAVTYPTKVEHVDEAQSLIANVSISGPQSWLTTFTQCVLYEVDP